MNWMAQLFTTNDLWLEEEGDSPSGWIVSFQCLSDNIFKYVADKVEEKGKLVVHQIGRPGQLLAWLFSRTLVSPCSIWKLSSVAEESVSLRTNSCSALSVLRSFERKAFSQPLSWAISSSVAVSRQWQWQPGSIGVLMQVEVKRCTHVDQCELLSSLWVTFRAEVTWFYKFPYHAVINKKNQKYTHMLERQWDLNKIFDTDNKRI